MTPIEAGESPAIPLDSQATIRPVIDLEAAGRLDEAEAAFGALLREHPALLPAWIGWIRVARMKRDWEGCRARSGQFLARFPDHPVGLLESGGALERLGRLDEAESRYAALVAASAESVHGWVGLARIGRRRQAWDACRIACERLQEAFPGRSETLQELALCLDAMGRHDEADVLYRKLAAAFPEIPLGWLGQLRSARRRDDWSGCLQHAEVLLARFPDLAEALEAKAVALQSVGQVNAADDTYAELCRSHPDHVRGWTGWARLAESREDWEQAARRWAECVARFPGRFEPYYGVIRASYEQGRLDDALNACAQLRIAGDTSARAVIEEATIRVARGDRGLDERIARWLPTQRVDDAAGLPLLAVAGHSHIAAIADAARSWQHDRFRIQALAFPESAVLMPNAGALTPPWRDVLGALSRGRHVFVSVRGNEHAMFGLARHPVPYRSLHEPSKGADVPYLSWSVLRASLRQSMANTRGAIRLLASFFPGRLVVLETPPPCPSESPMMDRVVAALPDVGRYGIASGAARMDLWKMRSEIVFDECRKLGVAFLKCPERSMDSQGFLVESACSDATHANALYGSWVLEQVVNFAQGNEDELR